MEISWASEVAKDTVAEEGVPAPTPMLEVMEERTLDLVRMAIVDEEEMAQDLTCQR